MEMIPCIKNKCIILPVCKSKRVIVCVPLSVYIENQSSMNTFKRSERDHHVLIWTKLNRVLPWVTAIFRNSFKLGTQGRQCSYTAEILQQRNKGFRNDNTNIKRTPTMCD